MVHKFKLTVNQEKSKVVSTNESDFLKFIFKGAKIRWSDKAFAEFKLRGRKLTGRSWGVSMGYLPVTTSYYQLAKLAEYLPGLDGLLRRPWTIFSKSAAH